MAVGILFFEVSLVENAADIIDNLACLYIPAEYCATAVSIHLVSCQWQLSEALDGTYSGATFHLTMFQTVDDYPNPARSISAS